MEIASHRGNRARRDVGASGRLVEGTAGGGWHEGGDGVGVQLCCYNRLKMHVG